MNITVSIFDEISGTVLRVVDCPEEMAPLQFQDGEDLYPGAVDGQTRYIDAAAYEDRERQPIPWTGPDPLTVPADGTTELVIGGLPAPTTVRILDTVDVVDDGTYEFTLNAPGTFTLELDAGPAFLPARLEVTAI